MLLHEQIEHLCESLKLNSIPTHWSSLAEQCIAQDKSYGEFLLSLLKCEQQQRDERTILHSLSYGENIHFDKIEIRNENDTPVMFIYDNNIPVIKPRKKKKKKAPVISLADFKRNNPRKDN